MDELSVLCLILFTLFLLCLFANQDIWRRTDIVYTLLVGSVYFFYPNFILNVQILKPGDVIHEYMLQLSGAALLGLVVIQYLTLRTNDNGVIATILVTKVVSYGTVLANSIIGHLKPQQGFFIDQHFFISVMLPAAAMLCTVRYLFTLPPSSHNPIHLGSGIVKHQIFDLMVLVFLGFYQCGFPEESLFVFDMDGWKMDALHMHLMRSLSGRVLAYAFLSFGSFSFQNHQDKLSYFKGRVVMFVLYFGIFCYNYYQYKFLSERLFTENIIISILFVSNCVIPHFYSSAPLVKNGQTKLKSQ